MHDNRHQQLIHVQLNEQDSLYSLQICGPRFLKSPEGPGLRQCMKTHILNFCEKWREDQSTLALIFKAAIGATNTNKASI